MLITSPIANLFRQSPFGPLQEHMRLVVECVKEFGPFIEALIAEDNDALEASRTKVIQYEKEADRVKSQIRTHLPKGLFLPVDRRDLLDLLRAQDAIADRAQDGVALLMLGKRKVPPALREGLLPFVRVNIEAALKCQTIIAQLDDLLELGFTGKMVERIDVMVKELSDIESQTDILGIRLTEALITHERDISPAAFIVWYDVLAIIGDIADNAENVGDRLRLLIAR